MDTQRQSFHDKLRELKALIESDLSRALPLDRPHTLYDPMKYTLQSGGKKLRPILVLLASECFDGQLAHALPAASAVELLHNFTLVHDDIMDNDQSRRGRPTVHFKWDVPTALLAGDGLVALAYQRLLETKTDRLEQIVQLFTHGILELCEGQALDKEFEARSFVTMDEYLEMIAKKTACLLSLCAQIGGLVAHAAPDEISALRVFGDRLGKAFQIQDDLLDITAETELLGKDFGSDVRRHKMTFLLVHATQHGSEAQIRAIRERLQRKEMTTQDILQIKEQLELTGAIGEAKRAVQNYIDEAKASLAGLAATRNCDNLRLFLEFILHRKA